MCMKDRIFALTAAIGVMIAAVTRARHGGEALNESDLSLMIGLTKLAFTSF